MASRLASAQLRAAKGCHRSISKLLARLNGRLRAINKPDEVLIHQAALALEKAESAFQRLVEGVDARTKKQGGKPQWLK